MSVQVVIPAAGSGKRLGYNTPKAIVPVNGVPLIVRTLQRIGRAVSLAGAVILAPSDHLTSFQSLLNDHFPQNSFLVISGGAERQESVSFGLQALDPSTSICVIHDAARPFVPERAVLESVEAASLHGGATVAIPVVDTILEANDQRLLSFTPDRSKLWQCQTPQTFQVDVIKKAHYWGKKTQTPVTDDATLAMLSGHEVKLVRGSQSNIKITSEFDLKLAQLMIEQGIV